MALLVPKQGELELLKRIFTQTGQTTGTMKLCLFKGNPVINDNTTYSDMVAIELSSDEYGAGGGRIDVTNTWTINEVNGACIAQCTAKVFNHLNGGTSGFSVGGYFVILETSPISGSLLLWAEAFPTPMFIQSAANGNGEITITLRLELE